MLGFCTLYIKVKACYSLWEKVSLQGISKEMDFGFSKCDRSSKCRIGRLKLTPPLLWLTAEPDAYVANVDKNNPERPTL